METAMYSYLYLVLAFLHVILFGYIFIKYICDIRGLCLGTTTIRKYSDYSNALYRELTV